MPPAAPHFGARLAASVARLLARPSANRIHAPDAEGRYLKAQPTFKSSRVGPLIAFESLRRPVWSPRDYSAFASEGFMQNPIVYRSVRMIAECGGHIPLLLYAGDIEVEDHPLKSLVRRPNGHQSWPDFMQALVGYLLVSGNAYIEAVALDGDSRIHGPDASVAERGSATTWASEGPRIRELHLLRPDRVQVVPGPDGWPEAFDYTVAGRTVRIGGEAAPNVRAVHHIKLFHPTNDHYGLSPLEAAAQAIDLHNTASKWNKALLDNSARPSGAIVYTARDGNLTSEQIERLKSELEAGFQGSANAGRPLLLEGGLDWKAMSLSPKDMDFIEARHVAAREIALALGVPPMLLGIPGDNTYANLAEAQRTFWRQTVLPLVERIASELSTWLAPAHGSVPGFSLAPSHQPVRLVPDLDTLPALASEREALWASLEKTSFLTRDEKRALAGFTPSLLPPSAKFNPYHDALGRFTTGDGDVGGGRFEPTAGRGGPRVPPKTPPAKPGPNPTVPSGTTIRNKELAGKKHPDTGIPFDKDGFPDFSSVATKTVTVPHTGRREIDFDAANRAAGLKDTPAGMTWHHHQDGYTMQLVPRDLHRGTAHTGSIGIGNTPGRK